MNDVEKLIEWILDAKSIVFFGGAGVSTESGIKDFRSKDGLYNQKYDYPPEEILSHHFFMSETEEFYKFYKDKLNVEGFHPNITHIVLKELEDIGKMDAVITQNIDGFHQDAGNKNVLELHGSVKRNYCMKCGKFYDEKAVFDCEGVPKCSCGGTIKPDVVLYEEPLDEEITKNAIRAIAKADLLIIGGTSLNVYPAAGYIHFFQGDHLVLINRDETPFDSQCNLVIHDSIGIIFKEIEKEIIKKKK